MRTKEFEVPSDFMTEFAEALAEHELANEINGVNEEGDILIEVSTIWQMFMVNGGKQI